MIEARCAYCRKYCKSINSTNKCTDCDKEFKSVIDKITKRYDGALCHPCDGRGIVWGKKDINFN